MSRVRVLLAAPSDTGLARVLDAAGARVLGRVAAKDLTARVRAEPPEIVVIDAVEGQDEALDAIRELMADSPVPVLVLAADRSDELAVRATGAVEVLAIPAQWSPVERDRLAARLAVLRGVAVVRSRRPPPLSTRSRGVVAVGASTGGPQALASLLAGLEGLRWPVLVVQHLRADFVPGFLGMLERVSALPVSLATDGDRPRPAQVYVAPTGCHLRLGPGGAMILDDNPPALHVPAVDELFRSVATFVGARAIGILLTGMGEDGAAGLLAMRQGRARTIAQDELSCISYGMPRAAVERGAAELVLPLGRIAPAILAAAGVGS